MLEGLGISVFDIAVIGIVLVGGLVGLITGFIRGGLFAASWYAAILVTLHGFKFVQPYGRQYISNDWPGDLIAAAGLFLAALIVFHIVGHIFSAWIRGSRLNALDRSIGLLAGFAGAIIIVAGAYLVVVGSTPARDLPPWARDARTRPLVEVAALMLQDFLPADLQATVGRLSRETGNTQRALELLNQPPATRPTVRRPGYDPAQRGDLERLIEGTQK